MGYQTSQIMTWEVTQTIMKILLVEDDPKISSFVKIGLESR